MYRPRGIFFSPFFTLFTFVIATAESTVKRGRILPGVKVERVRFLSATAIAVRRKLSTFVCDDTRTTTGETGFRVNDYRIFFPRRPASLCLALHCTSRGDNFFRDTLPREGTNSCSHPPFSRRIITTVGPMEHRFTACAFGTIDVRVSMEKRANDDDFMRSRPTTERRRFCGSSISDKW